MYVLDEKNMEKLGYHHHNFFCDGVGDIEEYVQESVKQGFKHIGISSHAPFIFFNKWSIPTENLHNYLENLEKVTEKYKRYITVLKSLEIDYLPGKIESFSSFKEKYHLDYTIGSNSLCTKSQKLRTSFYRRTSRGFFKKLRPHI